MFNITTSWWCKHRKKYTCSATELKNCCSCRMYEITVVLSKQDSRNLNYHVTSIPSCFYISVVRGLGSAVLWTVWTEQLLSSYKRFHKADVIVLLFTAKKQCRLVGRWYSSTYECYPVPIQGGFILRSALQPQNEGCSLPLKCTELHLIWASFN